MAKTPLKKGAGIKKSSLLEFKEKNGFSASNGNMNVSNADKPIEWLIMPSGFQEATHLPGFQCGTVNMIGGFSDTGKTTVLNHVLVAAQRQGFIPVIYDTENNMDWTYLKNMGFQAEPVYGDVSVEKVNEETGEVEIVNENRIIGYDGNFLYFNNAILADRYGDNDYGTGKKVKTKRKEAVIEDIAASMKELLDLQDKGEIDQGFVFAWDSIGSIIGYKSYQSMSGNNMFDAGSTSVAFSDLLNNRIPSSRKVSSPYTNTMVAISKIWLDSMTSPVGMPTLKYKNGNSFYYACHGIVLHCGGALTSGIKHLKATSHNAFYKYAIETKLSVRKNQLSAPFTISYEGPIICTPYGIISKDELQDYQQKHAKEMLEDLNSQLAKTGNKITESDLKFIEEEVIDE